MVLTTAKGDRVARIRECDTCDRRFTTEERIATPLREVERKPRKGKPYKVRVLRKKKV